MSRFETKVRWRSATTRSLPQFAPVQRLHARRPMLESLEERAMLSTIALTVNTLVDDPGGSVSGQTTLRDAINQADADLDNHYVVKIEVKGTIEVLGLLPRLDGNIVINGPGAANLKIQLNTNDIAPVFVAQQGETANTSLSGMTITGGEGESGIQNYSTLSIENCIFIGNTGNYGAAIYNDGTLTISNSTFTDNSSAYVAGGILNEKTLTVDDCTFSGNSAELGGAIFNDSGGNLAVNCSIFTGNSASSGGGIFTGNNGVVTVNKSIFINNSATGYVSGYYGGGGIASCPGGIVTVSQSIFIGNSATDGGGIYNAGTLTVTNSIFIGNSATVGGGIYTLGTLINTKNVFFDNTGVDIDS